MVIVVRVVATVAVVLLAVAIPAASAAPSEAEIERARARVLTPAYQPALPHHGPGDPASGRDGVHRAPPRRDRGQAREPTIDTREHRARREGGVLSSLMSLLMWGCVIVGGALIAFWIARELASDTEEAPLPAEDAEAAVAAATRAIIERPLGDADELAARGQYAEAIHTLLLRTLHELARSAMVRVAAADTSREILARVPLLAESRDALAGLIVAVELTHFGDEPANASDYARCRQQFHVFAAAFRSGLAAQPRHARVSAA